MAHTAEDNIDLNTRHELLNYLTLEYDINRFILDEDTVKNVRGRTPTSQTLLGPPLDHGFR